jgi:hypothetical protein
MDVLKKHSLRTSAVIINGMELSHTKKVLLNSVRA